MSWPDAARPEKRLVEGARVHRGFVGTPIVSRAQGIARPYASVITCLQHQQSAAGILLRGARERIDAYRGEWSRDSHPVSTWSKRSATGPPRT